MIRKESTPWVTFDTVSSRRDETHRTSIFYHVSAASMVLSKIRFASGCISNVYKYLSLLSARYPSWKRGFDAESLLGDFARRNGSGAKENASLAKPPFESLFSEVHRVR